MSATPPWRLPRPTSTRFRSSRLPKRSPPSRGCAVARKSGAKCAASPSSMTSAITRPRCGKHSTACASATRGGGSGRFRTAQQHDPARGFPKGPAGGVCRWPTGVFVAQVAKLEQIPEQERLHPEQVVADINNAGVPAYYEPDADAIVAKLNPLLKPGDVVIVFSNGGFGGIHQKLAGAALKGCLPAA